MPRVLSRSLSVSAPLLAAVAIVAVLASCSSDSADKPAGEAAATGSPDAGATATGGPAAESDAPGVARASGPWLQVSSARLRVPEGWQVSRNQLGRRADPPDGTARIVLQELSAAGIEPSRDSLRAMAEGLLGMKSFRGDHEMSLDASLGGIPAYRLAGTEAVGHQVAYGTVHDDQMLMLAFHFGDLPQRHHESLEQSVLATFEYR